MGFIKQDTAAEIYQCYREIMTAEKMLVDMEDARQKNRNDPHAQHLKDAFGRCQDLQLGIPAGENSHRLFSVSPKMAESVIRAHIASKKAELVEINERARIELEAPAPVTFPGPDK
jgi:hypothetical protein